jgi:hypothetical protein
MHKYWLGYHHHGLLDSGDLVEQKLDHEQFIKCYIGTSYDFVKPGLASLDIHVNSHNFKLNVSFLFALARICIAIFVTLPLCIQ